MSNLGLVLGACGPMVGVQRVFMRLDLRRSC